MLSLLCDGQYHVRYQRSGTPAYMWFLDHVYVCLIFNHTYYNVMNGILITKVICSAADISLLLHFRFWEPVY